MQWRDLTAETGPLVLPRALTREFETRKELASYLDAHDGRAVPHVDFPRLDAVLITVGARSSSGYSIRVVGVDEDNDRVVISVRTKDASLEEPGRPGLTFPYRLITLPASSKTIRVRWIRA